MSDNQVENAAENGPALVVEFRGQKLVERKYVDQKTGKAAEFRYVSVAAEMVGETRAQVTLEFIPPKGQDKLDLFPLQRGQVCVATLGSYVVKDGHSTARLLNLEPLRVGAGKAAK